MLTEEEVLLKRVMAVKLNRILSDYIKAHDTVFGGSPLRALRRLVPVPGFFDAIPYADLESQLRVQEQRLADYRSNADSIDCSPALREFVETYIEFADALTDTVRRLRTICARLSHRVLDPASYSKAAYKKDLSEYKASAMAYQEVGGRLNRLV